MTTRIFLFFLLPFLGFSQESDKIVMVIHGGAGWITPDRYSEEKVLEIRNSLESALKAGFAQIEKGEQASHAVVAAIQILEEDTNFNAGKGAVFTHDGKNELDASIMEGELLNAGAVAGVQRIKSPIEAALGVMEQSPHVLLSREGAEEFAEQIGLDMVEPDYFFTQGNYNYLQRLIEEEKNGGKISLHSDYKYGTVGAVALDRDGNLAAGTSTGGMTNKKWARIGDSPIIGSGTYADNSSCAVSCTGWGEYFIRKSAAFHVGALMKYAEFNIQDAAMQVIAEIDSMGAKGGLIALNTKGEFAWSFSTPGMFRAYITEQAKVHIEFYGIE